MYLLCVSQVSADKQSDKADDKVAAAEAKKQNTVADAFPGAFEMNAEWHIVNTSKIQKIKTNMSTLVQNGTTANRQAAKWK